jgi:uncharacterized protein
VKRITWVALSLLASASAHAASFDCAKASTNIEKLICGNAELSKLDEEMGEAYKAALRNAGHPISEKQAQKKWLITRDACIDANCVKHAYELRLQEIRVSNRMQYDLGIADDVACKKLIQDLKEGAGVQLIKPSFQAETIEELKLNNQLSPCNVSDFIESISYEPRIWEGIQDLPKEEQAQYGTKWTMTKGFRIYQVNFTYGGSVRILYGGGAISDRGEKASFSHFVVIDPHACKARFTGQVYDVVNYPDATFGIVQYGREPLIFETKYYEREKHHSLRFFRSEKGTKRLVEVCDFPVDNVDFLSDKSAESTPH